MLAVSSLSVAAHSITAVYGGDSNDATSTSSPLTQIVNQVATTTSLMSSANPSTFGTIRDLHGDPVTLSRIGFGGFQRWSDNPGQRNLKQWSRDFSGFKPVGRRALDHRRLRRRYQRPFEHFIGVDPNGKSGSNNDEPDVFGQPSTFGTKRYLHRTRCHLRPHLASVAFKDGTTTTLGSGTLSGGVTTLAVSNLSVAGHSITAVYAGDTNDLTSTSSAG